MTCGSGDLLADRRYAYAEAALREKDWPAAADLARQTIEVAPDFAAAWFLLGTAAERLVQGDDATREEVVGAYRRALDLDPADALGAGLRLALLGEGEPKHGMSPAYVRALFDDYAIRFDRHLRQGLGYRGPEIVRDAVRRACSRRLRPFAFGRALDLGCGTGLAGEALADVCSVLSGIDLSPEMVRRAEAKRLYAELATGDLQGYLDGQPDASADLVIAVDVFVYLGELAHVLDATARVLRPGGLLAFTVQVHDGDGVALGADHRFAHGEPYLTRVAAEAGLVPALMECVATRQDRGQDVPGLVLVLAR